MWKTWAGLVVYVIVGTALIVYHRWVLSPKEEDFEFPLVLAFCSKIGMTAGYGVAIAIAYAFPSLQLKLFGPPEHSVLTHWKRWTGYIVPLIFLSVLGLSLDTIAYTLVDLVTKQVIDAGMPLAILVFGVCAGCLAPPRDHGDDGLIGEEPAGLVPMVYRRSTGVVFWLLQKSTVIAIVVGTAMSIWRVSSVSWFGVAIDASTLIPAAWITFILKALMHQKGWTYFLLLAVTAIPETFLMGGVVYAIHGKEAFTAQVFHDGFKYACPILIMATMRTLLGFLILQNTSELSFTIAGNMVMGSVILLDLFYIKDREEPNLVNWIGFGVFVASLVAYTSTLWWTRPLKKMPNDLAELLGVPCEPEERLQLASYESDSSDENRF